MEKPKLMGISEPWLHLLETLATLAVAPPAGIVLCGEPGVGKTTLWRYYAGLRGDLENCVEIRGCTAEDFRRWRRAVQDQVPFYIHHWNAWTEEQLDQAARLLNHHPTWRNLPWGAGLCLATVDQGRQWWTTSPLASIPAFHLHIPPLRERVDDIPILAQAILRETADRYHRSVRGWSPEAMEHLRNHPWWGNTRELIEVTKQSVLRQSDGILVEADTVLKAIRHAQEMTQQPDWYNRARVFIARMFRYCMENPAGMRKLRPWHFILGEVRHHTARTAYLLMRDSEEDAARILGISRRTLKRYLRPPREKLPV